MAGRADPPEGTPEGVPGGGDDEYRSVVFDESFVRAARIQEFSAQERMGGTASAVRTRRPLGRAGAGRQALVLVLLIALAFGTAIYMGIRHPYRPAAPPDVDPLRITLVPLTPQGPVLVAAADRLFAADDAAHYPVGAEGITLPQISGTDHFSQSQVLQALTTAKEYLVASSLDRAALTGGDVRAVRELLNPGQLEQFDRSLARPADDGQYAATGWLVRFDPARIALADPGVRVRGTMTVNEQGADGLRIFTDHTMVYAVRAVAAGSGQASLFTVRRQLKLYFDRADLRNRQIEVQQAAVEAGPLTCAGDPAGYFRPLLAGQSVSSGAGVDPYDHSRPVTSVCGLLRSGPSPSPSR
ncbi:SCO2583 family membrane protein [Streptomyces sp. NPDC054933]